MTPRRSVVTIAHAFGNNRRSLRRALASDVDMIEVDVWYRAGELHVRHEHRLGHLPLLYDAVMNGHPPGPFALRIGRHFIRPDSHTLRLSELLTIVAGQKRLLLDVKGQYDADGVRGYVQSLVGTIREHRAEKWVAVCGQTFRVLNALRTAAPDVEVRYSIENERQWESFLRRMRDDQSVRRVCMSHRFIDAEKTQLMAENKVNLYLWTVDDPADAERLVSQGADGIISNNLGLLAALREGT